MVEIFKTNIRTQSQADSLILKLEKVYPGIQFNVDLMDCDNVLRGKSNSTIPWESIEKTVGGEGFECRLIDY